METDVLVIGSGVGGLTAAVALARAGRRVTVCEAHTVPGGYCHSFTADGHRFSPGVHYLGELGPGQPLRRLFEGLGLGHDLTFGELAPRSYLHVTLGHRTIPLVAGRDAVEAHLGELFPHEAAGIRGYFGEVERLTNALRGSGAVPVDALGRTDPWRARTGQRLVEASVRDPELRGVLGAIAGEYGIAPSRVPAPVHALTVGHYLNGAWYPRGGGAGLARAFVRALKRHGGVLRTGTPVRRLLTDGARITGAELATGEHLTAGAVVSNADPGQTYGALLAGVPAARELHERARGARWSWSCVSVFVGLDTSPAAWGLDSGNHWMFPDADVDAAFRGVDRATATTVADGPLFLSFPTLKDPTLLGKGRHTLEAFVFAPWELVRPWLAGRDAGYQAFKARVLDRVLDRTEYVLPGLRDHVTCSSVATPLTTAGFVRTTHGHVYGLEKNPLQVGGASFAIRPDGLDGLWLCGAGTLTHGIHGASLSGLLAAASVLGVDPESLLLPGPAIATWPSDDLEAWPPLHRDAARRRAAPPGASP